MAKLLKLRRGSTSQHSSFTGAEGEVTVDTTKDTLVVHDGSTAGGHAVAAEDMANVSSANIVGRLGTGSIVKAKLEADIIDGTKLADDAVNSEHYTDGSIDTAHIANDAVTAAKIADNAVEGNHIGTGEIAAGKLASNSVTSAKIADDSVDSEHIAAGAVDLEHMSSESVDEDNLKISNAGSNGNFLQKQSGNAGGLTWAAVDLSSYAPLAAPALTGNATAVNLTISGNLQVDGTTTTVNSSTMTVADKNIEIAKGAANDAAADGAGITVDSGDGDKTWNWVNSTDSWTSSEHIHLGDNKKLLVGTDSDAFLQFDGTNTLLRAGTSPLYIQTDGTTSITKNNGTESIAKFIGDGACELYHNDSKKIETTSSGINVTGAISVNGSALSTSPTITATANGSISANEAVIIESDGKVAGITAQADTTSTSVNGPQMDQGTNSYGPRYLNTAWDDDNETVFAFWYEHTGNAGQSKFYCAAGTLSGVATTSVTWGSKVEVYDAAGGWCNVVSLGSNKYLLTWSQDNLERRGQIATVSGTTVTMQGSSSEDSSNGDKMQDSDMIALSSTKAILVYADGTNDYGYCQVITISGNSISWGTRVNNASSHRNGGFNRVTKITSTKFLWTYYRAPFATVYGRICEVGSSDTTTTLGAEALFIDNKGQNHKTVWDPIKEQGAFIWDYANRSKPAALRWTYSGTTLTVQTTSITNDLTEANPEQYYIAADISGTSNIFVVYRDHYDSGLDYFKLVQDGDTFTASNITYDSQSGVEVMSAEASHASYSVHLVKPNKFLIVWGTKISSNNNYVRSFVRQYPATDLTTENFVGFSSAAYTNGQTATINVVGNTSTQSSLTPGQKYYIQNNGSLGLSADDPSVVGGRALTSTNLLITHA